MIFNNCITFIEKISKSSDFFIKNLQNLSAENSQLWHAEEFVTYAQKMPHFY